MKLSCNFQPGLKFHFKYMGFFSDLFGPFAPGFQLRLGFSARAELRPGLDPSPCNHQFDFMRICYRNQAEICHVIMPTYKTVSDISRKSTI